MGHRKEAEKRYADLQCIVYDNDSCRFKGLMRYEYKKHSIVENFNLK